MPNPRKEEQVLGENRQTPRETTILLIFDTILRMWQFKTMTSLDKILMLIWMATLAITILLQKIEKTW